MNKFNRSRFNAPIWFMVSILTLILLSVIGWVMNIFKLIGIAQSADPNYVMAALRAIGIFLAPVGAILGWFV